MALGQETLTHSRRPRLQNSNSGHAKPLIATRIARFLPVLDKSGFMAHPDPAAYHFVTMVLDIKAERETYLVEPDLREELGRELTPKVIVPCITRQSNVFMWPVSLPSSTGRTNTWTQSALRP